MYIQITLHVSKKQKNLTNHGTVFCIKDIITIRTIRTVISVHFN